MNVAEKNIKGLIKTLEEEKAKGMQYMHTLVTRNYDTNCIAFTDIDTVIYEIQRYGILELNQRGAWDTKRNNLNFSNSIGNIHDLYAIARSRGNIGESKEQIRKSIKEWAEGLPGKEFSTGLVLDKIGWKYITYLNTWGTTTVEKMSIKEFYNQYVV